MSFQTSLLSLLLAIFTEEFAIRGTHIVYTNMPPNVGTSCTLNRCHRL